MSAGDSPACNEAVIFDLRMMTDISRSTNHSVLADRDELLNDGTFIHDHIALGLEIARPHGLRADPRAYLIAQRLRLRQLLGSEPVDATVAKREKYFETLQRHELP